MGLLLGPHVYHKPLPRRQFIVRRPCIRQATARETGEGIPIYIDPVGLDPGEEDNKFRHEKLMKTPITMNLVGVPLRRTLKFLADQLEMGYGIKDGVVTMMQADMRWRTWNQILVMEESFPLSSPIELEVERARRGELTAAELDQLNDRLRTVEEILKRALSIRLMRFNVVPRPGGITPEMPSPSAGPQA